MNTKHIIFRAALIAAIGTVSTSAFAVGLGGGLGGAANGSLSAGSLSHSVGASGRMNAGVGADARSTFDSVQSHSVRAAHRTEAMGSTAVHRTRDRAPHSATVNGSGAVGGATTVGNTLGSSAAANGSAGVAGTANLDDALESSAAVNGSAGAASATNLGDSLESSAAAASAVDATAN